MRRWGRSKKEESPAIRTPRKQTSGAGRTSEMQPDIEARNPGGGQIAGSQVKIIDSVPCPALPEPQTADTDCISHIQPEPSSRNPTRPGSGDKRWKNKREIQNSPGRAPAV